VPPVPKASKGKEVRRVHRVPDEKPHLKTFNAAVSSCSNDAVGGKPGVQKEVRGAFKVQAWGEPQTGRSWMEEAQERAPVTPARTTDAMRASKPRVSSNSRKRSSRKRASQEVRATLADAMPPPKRGCSSLSARQRKRICQPVTKHIKLEAAKLPEDNYDISDLEEDLHGNRIEPDRTKKHVPQWCTNYVQVAEAQAEVDPDSIFGSRMPMCDMESIFPDAFYKGKVPSKRRRGSSCNWFRDGLTQREINAYAIKMGQKRSWSTFKAPPLSNSRRSKEIQILKPSVSDEGVPGHVDPQAVTQDSCGREGAS